MKTRRFVGLKIFLIAATVLILWAVPTLAQQPPKCVIVSARNYYALSVHSDSRVHRMELCLSRTTKSFQYEVNELEKPLTLYTTDGSTMTVTAYPLSDPDQLILPEPGSRVTFNLPVVQNADVLYAMRVELPIDAEGIVFGEYDGSVIGQILILDEHTARTDTITVSLGNLSTEWHFEVESRPVRTPVRIAVITPPDENGLFSTNYLGWRSLRNISTNRPVTIPGDGWLPGGYLAIEATFRR